MSSPPRIDEVGRYTQAECTQPGTENRRKTNYRSEFITATVKAAHPLRMQQA